MDLIITGEEIYEEIHNTCLVSDEFKPLLNKKYVSVDNMILLIQKTRNYYNSENYQGVEHWASMILKRLKNI